MVRITAGVILLSLAVFGGKGEAAVATHCSADEFPFLNAVMVRVQNREGGSERKLLSLCADKSSEPFERFSYRFGSVGRVELEAVASRSRRFQIFNELVVEHLGRDVVAFEAGKFAYEVSISTGMGHGVTLRVLKNGTEQAEFFSGTTDGVDFEIGPAEMRFDRSGSPVFELIASKRQGWGGS